jgi:hypothetical protein
VKELTRVAIALLLVLGFAFSIAPHAVQAKDAEPNTGIAGEGWTTGTGVDVSNLTNGIPVWLQLLSTEGVSLTAASQICHPLRGGQFGWVGEIWEYKNDRWVKLDTTNGWVPSVEGNYMSCAKAPEAGVYALFGYYVQPAYVAPQHHVKPPFDCSTLNWDVHVQYVLPSAYEVSGTVTGLPEGTEIDMIIDPSKSNPDTISGVTWVRVGAGGSYDGPLLVSGPTPISMFIDYSVPAYGCTYSYDHGF